MKNSKLRCFCVNCHMHYCLMLLNNPYCLEIVNYGRDSLNRLDLLLLSQNYESMSLVRVLTKDYDRCIQSSLVIPSMQCRLEIMSKSSFRYSGTVQTRGLFLSFSTSTLLILEMSVMVDILFPVRLRTLS